MSSVAGVELPNGLRVGELCYNMYECDNEEVIIQVGRVVMCPHRHNGKNTWTDKVCIVSAGQFFFNFRQWHSSYDEYAKSKVAVIQEEMGRRIQQVMENKPVCVNSST